MTIAEQIHEKLALMPEEKQRLVLNFLNSLDSPAIDRTTMKGALAHLNIRIDEKDIAEARREIWL